MPCSDGLDQIDREINQAQLGVLAPFVCGLFRSLPYDDLEAIMNRIDWNEAGIEPWQILGWCKEHRRVETEGGAYNFMDVKKFKKR